MADNTFADKKIICEYNDVAKYIKPGQNSYFFVVTTSFKTDEEALIALKDMEFAYLGIMGSKTKISKIKNNLKNAGYTDDNLNSLRAPIGLKIASNTTEEIAISIAAGFLKVKKQACLDFTGVH